MGTLQLTEFVHHESNVYTYLIVRLLCPTNGLRDELGNGLGLCSGVINWAVMNKGVSSGGTGYRFVR
ncbi:hypothetical protein, partial [Ketobacter sp.]